MRKGKREHKGVRREESPQKELVSRISTSRVVVKRDEIKRDIVKGDRFCELPTQ